MVSLISPSRSRSNLGARPHWLVEFWSYYPQIFQTLSA